MNSVKIEERSLCMFLRGVHFGAKVKVRSNGGGQ